MEADDEREFSGSATRLDGVRVALMPEQAKALWLSCEDAAARRIEQMPDTIAALHSLLDAKERLRHLGWGEGIYCPKDRTPFAIIEFGSTGIFSGFYEGEWPNGSICVCDGFTHPHGVMWKSLDKLTIDEKAQLEKCEQAERQMLERTARAFSQSDHDK